ncbi:ATP-binding protein [bacterium]|nr:ATP-binding protein [bacterium]
MDLQFFTPGNSPDENNLVAYLEFDNWDDFSFKTLIYLTVYDMNGEMHEIGNVKIGYFGQIEDTRTSDIIPKKFDELPGEFFSLGQSPEYYQRIKLLGDELAKKLLIGLNDIVFNNDLQIRALKEQVTGVSLLRGISKTSIIGQFKRILDGKAILTEYDFRFILAQDNETAGMNLDFYVNPESNPPTNIHILVGRNGVGKTYLLNNMVNILMLNDNEMEKEQKSHFKNIAGGDGADTEIFAGVISVAFSAFDPFKPRSELRDKTKGMRYSYVGLKQIENGEPMSSGLLTKEFIDSLMTIIALGKIDLWKLAISYLESEPIFEEFNLTNRIEDKDSENLAQSLYTQMSSGHRIVLLTITKLVESLEEKTLVLIDEPESHLHPPLLSAFIRSLSNILNHRNGVAIIATHSPVVLQEVPKNCVWIIRRVGFHANAERPGIETFGENVGILTREIFGLEVTRSGFHKLLQDEINKLLVLDETSYSRIISNFENNLGIEAKAILRALIAERKNKE